MATKSDPLYEKEYNCLVSDLVEGFPRSIVGVEGSKMYAWDDTTRELAYIFKKVFGSWYKL